MPLWELSVISLALLAIASVALYTVITGAPPMPSSAAGRDEIVRMLPPRVEGKIIDVGCGIGTLLFPLAERYPSCRVVGYERSPLPWLIARLRLALGQITGKCRNVTLVWDDYRRHSLADAGVIVCYLDSFATQQLGRQLLEQLAEALVISNTFAIPGWQPCEVHQLDGNKAAPIYLYRLGSC